MTMTAAKLRSATHLINSVRTVEGGGFVVRRPFPTQTLLDFDPFLMLDHLGPVTYAPGKAIGAPDHPHRGFETVSYILEGGLQHKDSQGNSGKLGPGDVQWMTAGAGVVHSEMPDDNMMKNGGTLHGFQIWVNLPARDKMMKPRYQDIATSQIPEGQSDDGKVKVRVVAGEALGAKAVIETRTPIVFLHYTLEPGGEVSQFISPEYNAMGYIISGSGQFGAEKRSAKEGQMIVFGQDGEQVRLASETGLSMLLLAGVPLNEPVARYGPFVMNTEEEIIQAVQDYQAGRMGEIDF